MGSQFHIFVGFMVARYPCKANMIISFSRYINSTDTRKYKPTNSLCFEILTLEINYMMCVHISCSGCMYVLVAHSQRMPEARALELITKLY